MNLVIFIAQLVTLIHLGLCDDKSINHLVLVDFASHLGDAFFRSGYVIYYFTDHMISLAQSLNGASEASDDSNPAKAAIARDQETLSSFGACISPCEYETLQPSPIVPTSIFTRAPLVPLTEDDATILGPEKGTPLMPPADPTGTILGPNRGTPLIPPLDNTGTILGPDRATPLTPPTDNTGTILGPDRGTFLSSPTADTSRLLGSITHTPSTVLSANTDDISGLLGSTAHTPLAPPSEIQSDGMIGTTSMPPIYTADTQPVVPPLDTQTVFPIPPLISPTYTDPDLGTQMNPSISLNAISSISIAAEPTSLTSLTSKLISSTSFTTSGISPSFTIFPTSTNTLNPNILLSSGKWTSFPSVTVTATANSASMNRNQNLCFPVLFAILNTIIHSYAFI